MRVILRAPNRRIASLVDLPIQRRKAELIMDGLSVAPIPLTAMGLVNEIC